MRSLLEWLELPARGLSCLPVQVENELFDLLVDLGANTSATTAATRAAAGTTAGTPAVCELLLGCELL